MTLFDLLLTLATRVNASLKLCKYSNLLEYSAETPKSFKKNDIEVKVGLHMVKLLKRLKFMETHKKVKPMFSQACDNLLARVLELLGEEKSGAFVELIQENSPTKEYF